MLATGAAAKPAEKNRDADLVHESLLLCTSDGAFHTKSSTITLIGTGIVERELFADTYRSHGLATVRYPVLEITAKVEPFENGNGYTLRVLRAGKPRHP